MLEAALKDFEDFDIENVTMIQLVKLTGEIRMLIHYWWRQCDMPRNDDGTFNLREVTSWYKKRQRKIESDIKVALRLTEIFRESA